MALFNVDKSTERRLAPSVNSHDVHLNRMALATDSIAPRANGTQQGGRVVTKDDRLVVYDTDNERIVIGRLPNGAYGIAISKAGHDVSEAFV